jgi:CarD family transcriptional regulator
MASKKKKAASSAPSRSKAATESKPKSKAPLGKARVTVKAAAKSTASSVKTSAATKPSAKKPTAKEIEAKKRAAVKLAAEKATRAAGALKSAKGKKDSNIKGKATGKQDHAKVVTSKKDAAKQTASSHTPTQRIPETRKAEARPAPVVSKDAKTVQTAPAHTPATRPPEKIAEPVSQKKAQPPAATVAPVKPVSVEVVAATIVVEKSIVIKPMVAKAEPKAAAGKQSHRTGFKASEFIVYPAHGVGQIVAIEEQEVAGFKLELFVISFAKDKMTLKVPLPKVLAGAIRKLAEPDTVKKSLDILMGRARIKRTMWSRRAQEYEAKINSGDLGSIAEVVRDLYRSDAQPEQSYSERQLYEAALDRMAREIAAVQRLTETEALKSIEANLLKGPKRGAKPDPADVAADSEIEQAA